MADVSAVPVSNPSVPKKFEHTKPGQVEYYWEHVRGGWAALRSDNGEKVCVLNTESFNGLIRDGLAIMEPVPKEGWTIHFTRGLFYVEDLKALVASMPTEA